jgi:integrase/recombinase XerD
MKAQSILRKKMDDALIAHGYALRTRKAYLYAVQRLAQFWHRPPDDISSLEVQAFIVDMLDVKRLSISTCRQTFAGIQFFFQKVLLKKLDSRLVPLPKNKQKIPELLTQAEVRKILEQANPLKHRMVLELCYGCGLRMNEALHLRVNDIDSERGLLKITQGKGGKDRMALLSPTLLNRLRHYWCQYHPENWLIYSSLTHQPLHHSTISKTYKSAKMSAGVTKQGGSHALRHAYATHQLASGMPVQQLQKLLGHVDLKSTMRYIQWLPNYQQKFRAVDLLAQLGFAHE